MVMKERGPTTKAIATALDIDTAITIAIVLK